MAKPRLAFAAEIAERGGNAVVRWPFTLDDWIQDCLLKSGETHLDNWVKRLRMTFASDQAVIMSALGRALEARRDLRPRRSDALLSSRSAWIAAKTVARRLGTTNRSVANLISADRVPAYCLPGKARTRRYIKMEALADIEAEFRGAISTNQVCTYLGISRLQVCQLRKAELLPATRRGTWWKYDKALVLKLRLELVARAVPHESAQLVQLSQVNRFGGCSLAEVLTAILAGEMAAYRTAHSAKTFKDIFLDKGELRAFRSQSMSYDEAARALGLSPRMIAPLLRADCLSATTSTSGRKRIDSRSIQRFREQYGSTLALARMVGTNTRSMNSMLQHSGIRPVVHGCAARGISSIWRLREAISIVADLTR